MKNLYLSQQINISGQPIEGPIEIPGVTPGNIKLATIVNRLIQFLIPLAAVLLLLVLIWGGYDFLLSRGDPEKIKSARSKITAGLIGFILLIISFLVVKIISFIFGLGGGFF